MAGDSLGYPFPATTSGNCGRALERIREALEKNDCQPRGWPKMRAQCPICRGNRMDTLAASPRRDGRGATMHCFAAACDIREIVAALDLTMTDLYDEPPAPARFRPAPLPPPPFNPAPVRTGLTPTERLAKGLVIERDWECVAFWEFVTRPFRTENTPEQRMRLAEAECRRDAAERWERYMRGPSLRLVSRDTQRDKQRDKQREISRDHLRDATVTPPVTGNARKPQGVDG